MFNKTNQPKSISLNLVIAKNKFERHSRPLLLCSQAFTLATGMLIAGAASAQEIIDNGTIQLGVNPAGNLITGSIGLTFLPTSGEALEPGCACEGWGISDLDTGEFFMAGEDFGFSNILTSAVTGTGTGTDGLSTAESASSMVTAADGALSMTVTHDFTPSSSPNLYQVDVTMLNTGADSIGNLVYRRTMDWDVPPTEFTEFVTIQGWPASRLIGSSDDGFVEGNPNTPLTTIAPDAVLNGNFTDSGPDDHGAAFDFSFGTLAAAGSEGFTIFYGAAASESDALLALSDVGAEVYSLGQPSSADGATLGVPNTFIFGFAGVGGTPVVAAAAGAPVNPMIDFAALVVDHHLDNTSHRLDSLAANGDSIINNQAAGGDFAGIEGFSVHASGFGHTGDIEGTSNNVGFDYDSSYFGIGADYTFNPQIELVDSASIGVAFGNENLSGDRIDNNGSIDADVYSYSLYVGASNLNGFYGDFHIFYNDLEFEQSRIGMTTNFRSSPEGESYGGRARLGYNFDIEKLGLPKLPEGSKFGFYGEITHRHTEIDPFSEDNNGLTTESFSDDSNIVALGARLSVKKNMGSYLFFGIVDVAGLSDLSADDFKVDQTTTGGAMLESNVDGYDGLTGRLTATIGFIHESNWFGSLELGGKSGSMYGRELSGGVRVGRSF